MSGPDDPSIARRHRTFRRRLLLIVVVATVTVLLVAFAIGLTTGHNPTRPVHRPEWASVAGGVLTVLGLAVELAAIVRGVRIRRALGGGPGSPLTVLGWGSRRKAMARLRGRAPFADSDLPFLRRTAAQMAGQRWVVWLMAGLTLLQLGGALTSFTIVRLIFAGVLILILAVGAALVLRDVRAARAFLAAHPEPGPGPAAAQ
ncbi:hypothetical protein ACFFWC_14755 [Plantactinospora siamensis]|uniref:Uncharacterized protein n=1 Tax=Plantactinospora siamensis TaxID=555372 RepID=A0ABV6P0Y9_9ACTN